MGGAVLILIHVLMGVQGHMSNTGSPECLEIYEGDAKNSNLWPRKHMCAPSC